MNANWMIEDKHISPDSEFQIGKRIKNARTSKGIKQYELARDIDITANYLSLIETGKKSPSLRTINKIAKSMELSVTELISYDPLIEDLKEISKKYDIDRLINGLNQIKDSM